VLSQKTRDPRDPEQNIRTLKEGPRMKKFYRCSNNSVTAVVTAEVYWKIEERMQLLRECERKRLPFPELPPIVPIFTFSRPSHGSHSFHTGSLELMGVMLEECEVERGSLYVPFSNGIEHRYQHKPESARWEWQFRTSLEEGMVAFGLTMS